jgi:hypothetical protein
LEETGCPCRIGGERPGLDLASDGIPPSAFLLADGQQQPLWQALLLLGPDGRLAAGLGVIGRQEPARLRRMGDTRRLTAAAGTARAAEAGPVPRQARVSLRQPERGELPADLAEGCLEIGIVTSRK